jgi:uncharacterized protein (TIGR03000 family)
LSSSIQPSWHLIGIFHASHTMKLHQCHWQRIAVFVLLGTIATSSARAQYIFYSPMGPFVRSPLYTPPSYYSYSSNPYVAPYPAYGVIPGPIVLSPWQFGSNQTYTGRTAEDYGYTQDQFTTPPRQRNSMYPAIPYEKSPADRLADIRRARFEIQVPRENAVVLVDGVETKQSGLSRVYVTPPMAEDRLFTSEFEVRWTDDQGKTHTERKNFEFVAGETLRHSFK